MLYTCGSYSNFAPDSPFQFPFLWKLGKFPPCHFTVRVDFSIMVLHSSWTKTGHISHSRPILMVLKYWSILFQKGYLRDPKKSFGGLNKISEQRLFIYVYVCVLLKYLWLQRRNIININLLAIIFYKNFLLSQRW